MSGILNMLWYSQGGCCFYCGRDTYAATGMTSKAEFRATHKLNHLTRKQLRRVEASIEHLIRRADGGANTIDNFVMACVDCNEKRKEKPVLLHLADMRAKGAI